MVGSASIRRNLPLPTIGAVVTTALSGMIDHNRPEHVEPAPTEFQLVEIVPDFGGLGGSIKVVVT